MVLYYKNMIRPKASYGNRITNNALRADSGKGLIQKALQLIDSTLGWRITSKAPLFTGTYFDSQKVGSYIVRVINDRGEAAVLKLQLYPLPFDEGYIIRSLEGQIKSTLIRTPKILADKPWNKADGFGYLIFEDLTALNNLWSQTQTTETDRQLHKTFLCEFYKNVLPVSPWIDEPQGDLRYIYQDAIKHFKEIADKSDHKHIQAAETADYLKQYFEVLERVRLDPIHFTHGHMSGFDVKYDTDKDSYILLANLYWSYRPKYYELTFPMWVDLMWYRDSSLTFDIFLKRVLAWVELFSKGITDNDPSQSPQFWFNLLERSMNTIMLDLGASEWKEDERAEKRLFKKCILLIRG
jgi:hypothetical protein